MECFTVLDAVAAPLPDENVDTDVIFPARFLLIMDRDGLGRYAFHDRRFAPDGSEMVAFVLNQPGFRTAGILVAGANFGCGSSREQAVWALLGFGIRCIIAPSFGEIFFANCFKNGVLPIVLSADIIAMLSAAATSGARFAVDLVAMTVTLPGTTAFAFEVDPAQRLAMLNGWDETDTILNTDGAAIRLFEARQYSEQPWLYREGVPT